MEYLIALYTGKKIYTYTLKNGITATVGDTKNDNISAADSGLGSAYAVLACDAGGVRILTRQPFSIGNDSATDRILSAGDVVTLTDKITLAVFRSVCSLETPINLNGIDELALGRSYNDNDICLKAPEVSSRHLLLRREGIRWTVTDIGSRNGTFVDGTLVDVDTPLIAEDVNIFAGGYIFHIHSDELRFTNTPHEIELVPEIAEAVERKKSLPKRYPFFQRSPRIRTRAEKVDCEIFQPPNVGNKPQLSWLSLLLPPIMMVIVMGGVATVTKNYNMLIYSLPMSMISVVVSIINTKTNLKKWQEKNGLAMEKYSEHLKEREKTITDAEGAYIAALSTASPGVDECIAIADSVSRRLWERTPRDNDFLSVRLGTGTIASNVDVKIPQEQISLEENPFTAQTALLKESHTVLTGVPVCHSFLSYPITGLAGRREDVMQTVRRIVMDIACHHSYEDVKIICVYPEEEKEQWDWLRWLPHVWNAARAKRYIACTTKEARTMLREAGDTLKLRRREAKENSSSREFVPETPFYFMILADRDLTEASGEQFLPESDVLGFAALYAYGDIGALPGECQSVIMCGEKPFIQNTRHDAKDSNIYYIPDSVRLSQADSFARSLAPVRLLQSGGGSKMPKSVTFLQGFNAKTIEDLDVIGRWGSSHSEKSLAAPIGIKENGDVFEFDVFEKAMGPHGIAAGTSGSGKSEMLTTWLLSMALTFSPDDVNFALIEFKGNDLSNILKDLPHIAGIISNLNDPSAIVRGLKSLKGEKDRRMRLFEQSSFLSSKSIFAYQKYQKSHPDEGLEPLPYLIIVVDEFAEFVTQYPEYNDEIVSIARVGRSVGMYMVLTMQSPQGVVKGQVSSNTKFRVCLRTATAAESKEIIGTDDAYNISAPGRAYVKVGNNEVYEQVQTFYAKAPYNPLSGQTTSSADIRLVNLNGTREKLVNYEKTVKAVRDEMSEGNAIVKDIIEQAETHHIHHARPVWTEPLPEKLLLSELIAGQEAFDTKSGKWAQINEGLSVTVGRIDDPEHQTQYPLVLNFMDDGHQVLYGAPATGKTTFLQTVLLSAAMTYTPEQVNFIIFDYGSFILGSFDILPHCLIAADPTDEDKLKKARDYLQNELASRRRLFSARKVSNLIEYREDTGKPFPAIIVAIDNIASLYNQSPDIMDVLNQTARDGSSLGIYLMMTAGSTGSYMFRISQYVKAKYTLQMTDKAEYRDILGGDGKMQPGRVVGRGLTKGPLEYQTALYLEGGNRKLTERLTEMSEAWTGKRASILEAETAPVDIGELKSSGDGVQIGIDKVTREPVEFVFRDMNGCVISGKDGGGKTNVMGFIAKTLGNDPDTKLYIFEKEGNTFLENLCPNAKTVHDAAGVDGVVAELESAFDERDEDSKGRIVFCIDDFNYFYSAISNENVNVLNNIIQGGADRGIYFYLTCNLKGLERMTTFKVKPFMSCLRNGNAVVAGGSLSDCRAFENMYPTGEKPVIGEYEGCIIHGGKITALKLGKVEGA